MATRTPPAVTALEQLSWLDAGLRCAHMEQKLWMVALIPVLQQNGIFFLGVTEGDGREVEKERIKIRAEINDTED